jgi:hypothetical protein
MGSEWRWRTLEWIPSRPAFARCTSSIRLPWTNAKDRVVLIFSKSELDEYKREEPPPEDVPEGIPFTDAAFITEEEQMRMRRQMEDELAQQRSHLPG